MANLKFRISTGLKNIIGKELINNDDIAIFELVKNSYDAGARHVKIIFEGVMGPSSKAKIIVIDNGDGMSLTDIKTKWLVVGFSEKKYQIPKDMIDKKGDISKTNRAFAGAKGIGRFSADRLGRFMTMYTKQEGKRNINKIKLDWKNFERDQKKDFDTINVEHSDIPKIPETISRYGVSSKGTILEISGLNSKWDEKKLLSLKRYLQRLINPTIDQNRNDFRIELISPEFKTLDKKERPSRKSKWIHKKYCL